MARDEAAKRREDNEIEFGRIVAFSDGVFSIAITLLVLNLGIEKGLTGGEIDDELWGLREDFLAFAISFAVIGKFWIVHHRFFGEVRAFDGRLIALNLLYLAWIVLIPFSSEVLGEYGGETAGVVVYSVNLVIVILVGLLMTRSAHGRGLTTIDEAAYREAQVRSAYIAAVFALSIPIAFVAPALTPLLWLVLFVDPTARLAGRRDVSPGG
ncbi:MAG TPA: TMEM175 family protein [Solirubrobacterales bacterium]|nr:TMEM175 family protein [Solirubrobacterales bacterium]